MAILMVDCIFLFHRICIRIAGADLSHAVEGKIETARNPRQEKRRSRMTGFKGFLETVYGLSAILFLGVVGTDMAVQDERQLNYFRTVLHETKIQQP